MGGSIVGAVDLYFISCICGRECLQSGWFIYCIMRARKLNVGGSVVGAVNLYYISCARVICGREHSWSGYIWAGELLERLI